MPMAQALVMVRHKVVAGGGLDPLSPMGGPPGPPVDTSLITSSVRKRKSECGGPRRLSWGAGRHGRWQLWGKLCLLGACHGWAHRPVGVASRLSLQCTASLCWMSREGLQPCAWCWEKPRCAQRAGMGWSACGQALGGRL